MDTSCGIAALTLFQGSPLEDLHTSLPNAGLEAKERTREISDPCPRYKKEKNVANKYNKADDVELRSAVVQKIFSPNSATLSS